MADTYYTVVSGDNLTRIANKYGTTWRAIYELNSDQIKNPNLIYPGQTLLIFRDSSGGGSSSSSTTQPTQATITSIGHQMGTDNTIFAVWTWERDNTENYETIWDYYVAGNDRWFRGSDSTTDVQESLYNPPTNASKVRFKVKPISKTYTSNGNTTSYWTASWSTESEYNISENVPDVPDIPDVEIDGFKLTATLDNLDEKSTEIQFQIVKDNASVYNTGTATVSMANATYSCTVEAGAQYKVRCRAARSGLYSDWTDYSANYSTQPAAPTGFTVCQAKSKTSVYLQWNQVANADTYEIQYTTESRYFDGSDSIDSVTGIETTNYEKTGLATGDEYFFRLRAVKDGNLYSAWSEISSVSIGKPPVAPTTWSSTTTAITGEPLNLYWIHNAEDGSSQTYAELELTANGLTETETIQNSTDEDEKDKTSVYSVDTSEYVEGTQLSWRVRTAGVTLEYGDWSIMRTIDIYSPPTLQMNVEDASHNALDTVTFFPFYIRALAAPNTQAPTSYHVTITSNDSYETVDIVGREVTVNAGDIVYSKHFDITAALDLEMMPSDIDLENNVTYTVECVVSMNSGLTASSSSTFTVAWTDEVYTPDAEIAVDKKTAVAYVKPFCRIEAVDPIIAYSNYLEFFQNIVKMVWADDSYINDAARIADLEATGGYDYDIIEPLVTATLNGETLSVYDLTEAQLEDLGYSAEAIEDITTPTSDEPVYELVDDISLSVYRREFDGTFTEIATGLDNNYTTVTDPHPSLDFARYRIVAVTTTTGAVGYRDLPGYPVGEKSIIIQWNEDWSTFDSTEESELEQPAWSGSLLRLPYNIDVSNSNNTDVSLIEYIGRSHPTSYYGTQLGEAATWKTDVDKTDKETLYALRRLAIWRGDVYAREPSGTGYWANVAVSFSQTHDGLTIPVTLNVTRVEGGM